MHFLLFSNVNKDPDQEVTGRLQKIIESKGSTSYVVMEGEEASEEPLSAEVLFRVDIVIVLGGDGTLLRASHAIGESKIPMIGVNLGTTGFLTEVETGAMEEMVDSLLAGKYTVERRMRLAGAIRRKTPGSGQIEKFSALNDIVVIREGVLRLIAIRIYVNGVFFDSFEADGVILSTPTGSTGYNLSAGGPIVSPQARRMVMTPVSPHSLSKKSIVFDAKDEIRIVLTEKRKTQKNEAIVSFDGYMNYEIAVEDEVEIHASDIPLHLIRLKKYCFYDVLSRKLGPR